MGKFRSGHELSRPWESRRKLWPHRVISAGFPDRLMPLGIRISKGQAVDVARTPRSDIDFRLRSALKSCTPKTEIWIAMDDDPEGDVIAMDVAQVIVDVNPVLVESCLRLRLRALTQKQYRAHHRGGEGFGR